MQQQVKGILNAMLKSTHPPSAEADTNIQNKTTLDLKYKKQFKQIVVLSLFEIY